MAKIVSPGSSINKSADELGPAPKDLQVLGPRLIDYGGGPSPAGYLSLGLADYSVPIYKYDETKTNGKPNQGGSYYFPLTFSLNEGSNGNVPAGTWVPDNPTWVGGSGNDNIMIVERESTGEAWGWWMVRQPAYNAINWTNIFAGLFWKQPQHCAAACGRYTNFYQPVSAKDDMERGNGMKERELLVTVDEMLEGEIKHALQLTLTNTWFSEGPAHLGKLGVDYLYPARRCEWDRARSIPTRMGHAFPDDKNKLTLHGTRIRFKLTAKERSDWLDKNVTATKTTFREFCRIYLNAMCDYGFVTTDTGNWGMLSQFDGVLGPAGPVYKSKFGIDRTKKDIFANQVNVFSKFMAEWRSRVEVVAPPAAIY